MQRNNGKPSRIEAFFSEERAGRFVDRVKRGRVAILGATAIILVIVVVGMFRMTRT